MLKEKYLALVLCLIALTQFAFVNACLSYDKEANRCSLCPFGMHIYKGNCIYDIAQCVEYHQGADCKKCQKGYKVVKKLDRIECKQLQIQQKIDYFHQQIDPTLPEGQTQDLRQHFYSFLNGYLTEKYHDDHIECQLVKIVNKLYKNEQNEVVMIYKTSTGTVEKTVAKVIGDYKSFELKQTVDATLDDIADDEIVIFETEKFQQKSISLASKVDDVLQSNNAQQISSQKSSQNSQEIKQTSDFNFEYQKPQAREKDIGFQTSNEFLKLSNNKILNDEAKVVGCFAKSSGLRKHYKIFYKTAGQQMYEGEVIYDIVRRRAYILNFGKQFTG